MSVQKRDINLFKAAGGERAKAKKRPITSYLFMVLAFVIIAVIGGMVFLNYDLGELRKAYQTEQGISDAYDQTLIETADLVAEYKAVISSIYQAEKINEYLDIRSSRYTRATNQEADAIFNGIVNSNTAHSYLMDVDLRTEGKLFLDNLDKSHPNYDLVYGALAQMIELQKCVNLPLWYCYFRGQMVVVFSGGLPSGVNLAELATLLYNGISYNGETYEPFMNLHLNGARHVDAKYMAAPTETKVYNVMLLTMKTVEERAIDVLEASSERMYLEAVMSGNIDDFRYEITKIEYENETGTITVGVTIVESDEYLMKTLCDDLDASVFFDVSSSVVSPPLSGIKSLDIVLDIAGAYVAQED